MSDPAPLSLTPDQRQRLLAALARLPLQADQAGRGLLLDDEPGTGELVLDLPRRLAPGILRADNPQVDFNSILEGVENQGALYDGRPALLSLLQNALALSRGTVAGPDFEALYAELTAPLTPTAPADPEPRTPNARDRRFYEGKKRSADLPGVGVWESSMDREPDEDVLHPLPPSAPADLAQAYAAREWVRVIELARALEPHMPPEVSACVGHAWRMMPVEERVLRGHQGWVWAIGVTPDGRQILAGSDDMTLRLWNLASGLTLHIFPWQGGSVHSLAVLPDGRRVLAGSEDETMRLWDLTTGQTLRTFTGHQGTVFSVAATPDGRLALSGDRAVRLWDLTTGQELGTLTSHQDTVFSVAVTPDGRQALSGSGDKTLRLWDLATGQTFRTFTGHHGNVLSIAVAPDGRQALSGSGDKTLRLWDLATGRTLRTFTGHRDTVRSVALTPNGRLAFSCSSDETVRLWDLTTGQLVRTLRGHLGKVLKVAVAPDSRTVVSSGADSTVRVWTFPPAALG